MSGLTWARNDLDNHALSTGKMLDEFLMIKTQHEAQFGKPLRAVKLSRLTLLSLPLTHTQDAYSISTFYGVPIEIDDSLGLWEFKEVYA